MRVSSLILSNLIINFLLAEITEIKRDLRFAYILKLFVTLFVIGNIIYCFYKKKKRTTRNIEIFLIRLFTHFLIIDI